MQHDLHALDQVDGGDRQWNLEIFECSTAQHRHGRREDLVPRKEPAGYKVTRESEAARGGYDGLGRHARGAQCADETANACAGQQGWSYAFSLEELQHTEMREATRAAAPESETDPWAAGGRRCTVVDDDT
jgi:hypothetical protein